MARVGKIARLPKCIRDVVCKKMEDGQPAEDVLNWLNEQPQVKAVLEKEFDGDPINTSNMHRWMTGGYLDWKRTNEQHSSRGGGLSFLLNKINTLKRIAQPEVVNDMVLLFATALGEECVRIEGIEEGDERRKELRALVDGFAKLRGAELAGGKLHLDVQKLQDLKFAAQKRQNETPKKIQRTPEETQAVIRRILSTD